MLNYEEFENAAWDIAETFPEEFFRELNGGIVIRNGKRIHPHAEGDDLFILGEYHRNRYLGRSIVLYYGSFVKCFQYYKEDELKEKIRKVLLHEFRHHLESLAGEKDLEIEDAIELSRYKQRKQMQRNSAVEEIVKEGKVQDMKPYKEWTREELLQEKAELEAKYQEIKEQGLQLDMSRGKPSQAQLDIANGMMDVLGSTVSLFSEAGVDCRNYGVMDGIPEARQLLADLSEVPEKNILIYGNSSLNVMFDTVSRAMTMGVCGHTPWGKLDKVKFLCPVPGYDRHFGITEFFGIEMINVPLLETGPDMDLVEKLVAEDPSIKGIWCVPKYSNPTGISYSDETVRRFARLKPAAPDFRIFWDNAYSIHHLYEDDQDVILELLTECEKAGNEDLVYKFISTSKVSFPGSGIAAMAASEANLEDARKAMYYQTIGHDKLNQLRHVRYFKDMDGIRAHMKKHADILRPKFEIVLDVLERELGGRELGSWVKPKGGYFIAFDALDGCAKKIVAKAKEAGVIMTGAGATFPYGKDPKDSNIRIAPSFPTPEELEKAAEIFVLSVKLVSIDKLLAE